MFLVHELNVQEIRRSTCSNDCVKHFQKALCNLVPRISYFIKPLACSHDPLLSTWDASTPLLLFERNISIASYPIPATFSLQLHMNRRQL
jgi:hypothetical protein